MLSLPTAVPCAFLVTDFYGACFSAGGCRLHHKDESVQLIYSVRHLWRSRVSRTRLDMVGLRQMVRANCTVRRAVWCGRHSIVLRQGVMEVESFHKDVVVVRVMFGAPAIHFKRKFAGLLRSFTFHASICKTPSLSKLCTSSRK